MDLTSISLDVAAQTWNNGFSFTPGDHLIQALAHIPNEQLTQLFLSWNSLEIDGYMSDGGKYRLRRYGRYCYRPAADDLHRLPHATVFQAQTVNNFAGGIHRDFAPILPDIGLNPVLSALIRFDFSCFHIPNGAALQDPWEVWVHQIRIETSAHGSANPAPEGIHHDGHDFIAMHLVGRSDVNGGVSHIFDNSQTAIFSHEMVAPLDSIHADDHRVMHSVDPIVSRDGATNGHRDILIIDFDRRPNLSVPKRTS